MTRTADDMHMDLHDDEDANPIVETQQGALVGRYTYKDGTFGWVRWHGRSMSHYEQDQLEEAYDLGRKSIERQMQNLRQNVQAQVLQAKADGMFITARTVFERGKR